MFLYPYFKLVLGALYPAYSSYKAIKNKNVKEYSRWMMYWVVFALFNCIEVFSDILVGIWLPCYYEIKMLFIIWLISHASGARIMYKHIVHPELTKREQVIDLYISKVKDVCFASVLHLIKISGGFFHRMLLQMMQIAHSVMFLHLQNNEEQQQTAMEVVDDELEKTVKVEKRVTRARVRKKIDAN